MEGMPTVVMIHPIGQLVRLKDVGVLSGCLAVICNVILEPLCYQVALATGPTVGALLMVTPEQIDMSATIDMPSPLMISQVIPQRVEEPKPEPKPKPKPDPFDDAIVAMRNAA